LLRERRTGLARIDDYKAAVALAAAELRNMDPREAAARAGAQFDQRDGRPGVILAYFGRPHWISWPDVQVGYWEGEGEVNLQEQILMLHYLQTTQGKPPTGEQIDFRQVPGGNFYFSAFEGRAKAPLLKVFGHDLDLYRRVAAAMGGRPVPLGDMAMVYQALPLVPITHVLWRGDEEFPANANLLFDQTIVTHLPTEDIAAISGMSVYRLMGLARQMAHA
jgi:hypothetical protein